MARCNPSLMGFGEEDQFVVITDGQPQMNMLLFWRNAIPESWQQLPEAPSRRIAGQLPVTMGDPSLRRFNPNSRSWCLGTAQWSRKQRPA